MSDSFVQYVTKLNHQKYSVRDKQRQLSHRGAHGDISNIRFLLPVHPTRYTAKEIHPVKRILSEYIEFE